MNVVYACPHCREPLRLVPIMYGDPEPDMVERAQRGELVIGAPTVGENAPEYACGACGKAVRPSQIRSRSSFRLVE